MKIKDNAGFGMMMSKRMRIAGITYYMRNGQVVGRPSSTHEKRSNTLRQFVQRQKMRHTTALWKMLHFGCNQLMFTERRTAYQNFASLANSLPAVYVVDNGRMNQASFLMPGIPVSDGTLPAVTLELGEVDGVPALITDLKPFEMVKINSNVMFMDRRERLWFYTAVQTLESEFMPRVRFSMREIKRSEMTLVDGHYVLKGEEFADEMKGWAIVRVVGDNCSSQTIVTRCTLYKQYTTQEALERAADSYGGLTETPYLRP